MDIIRNRKNVMDIQKREKMELLWSSVFSLFCISIISPWTNLDLKFMFIPVHDPVPVRE